LVPRPSYPLFDFLATLESIQVEPYPAEVWDITHWRSTRTRALVTVHPNNPTGQATHPAIATACAEQGLPLIVDEVFLDYAWAEAGGEAKLGSFVQNGLPQSEGLGFVLSGLSKVCALPQMKLGWIVLNGTNPIKSQVRERLELIADTYLSASAPIQHAAPQWLAARHGIQDQIKCRIVSNLKALDASGLQRRPADGGWTTVVNLSGTVDEEALVLRLLNEANVLVQPGYFYDFPEGEALVLSLLPEPPEFAEALNRMKQLGGKDGVFA
jgi:alanine-synthesizing transaminase